MYPHGRESEAILPCPPVGEASGLLGGDTLLSGSPHVKAGVVRQHLPGEPVIYIPFTGA